MRRFAGLMSVITAMLLGILALHAQPVALAQDATPSSEEMVPEGVTFEPVTFATSVALPSQGDLFVFRATLAPGAAVPIEASDPSLGILLVDTGTLTVQSQGPVTVTRGAGLGEAMATAEASGDMSRLVESIAAGEAVTLEAGDAAYIPANTAGEIRNEGQQQAVGLAFLVIPPDDMAGEATPTP